MKEFSSERQEPVEFKIQGQIFEAVPEIPAEDFGRIAELQSLISTADGKPKNDLSPNEQIRIILEMLELLLLPESAEQLAEGIKSKSRPIPMKLVLSALTWLMNDVYLDEDEVRPDARPTQRASE